VPPWGVVEGPSGVIVQMTLFGVGSAIHPSQGKQAAGRAGVFGMKVVGYSSQESAKIGQQYVAHTSRWADDWRDLHCNSAQSLDDSFNDAGVCVERNETRWSAGGGEIPARACLMGAGAMVSPTRRALLDT
jgi:hypothetical protein